MSVIICDSSVGKCQTRNRESPGSNPPGFDTVSKIGYVRSLQDGPGHSAKYLAMDSGGDVSEQSSLVMFPREVELVSE